MMRLLQQNKSPRSLAKSSRLKAALLSLTVVFAGCADRRDVPMTAGERQIASDIFGAEVDTRQLHKRMDPRKDSNLDGSPRVAEVSTPTRVDYLIPYYYRADFSMAEVQDTGLFAHELTHIWQRQNGYRHTRCLTQPDGYRYQLSPEYRFDDYCMEQQGAIIQDYVARFHHAARSYPFYSQPRGEGQAAALQALVENRFPAARRKRLLMGN